MAWSEPHLGQAEGAGLVIALEVVFHPPGPRPHGHHDHTAWAGADNQTLEPKLDYLPSSRDVALTVGPILLI